MQASLADTYCGAGQYRHTSDLGESLDTYGFELL